MSDDKNPADLPVDTNVDRRSFMGRVVGGAALIGAGVIAGTTTASAQTGINDADPVDPATNGRGRPNARATGMNDDDPVDNAGYGRGPVRATGRRTGLNDDDPQDAAGYGRGRPNARRTGLNDSDPVDDPGFGRGGGR